MKPSTIITIVLAVLFLLVYFSGSIAVFATDWKWFEAVGFGSVFQTTVLARLGLGAVVGLVAFAVLQGNAVWALRTTRRQPLRLSDEFSSSPIGQWLQKASLMRLVTIACVVIALIAGAVGSSFWKTFLLFLHGSDFGYTDPIIGHDASFYVFTLPFLQFARGALQAMVVLATLATVGLYATRGAIRLDLVEYKGQVTARGIQFDAGPRRHVAVLLGTWIALMAAGVFLTRYGVMYDQSGLLSGASQMHVVATLPLLLVQSVVALIGAALVAYGVARSQVRLWVGGIVLGVIGGVLTALVPSAYQSLVVLPNELALEGPYIEHHIQATRLAFALDDIEERRLSGEAKLTWSDIQNNGPTIKNVRLWDHGPLLETFSQVQEIRTYYNFPGVDNDRYMINGEMRQTMLSPRELQASSLPARARTWVNESMVYTHGYGVALGPVNEVTPEGLPYLWIKDLPPEYEVNTEAGRIQTEKAPDALTHVAIDHPAIYYGESMRNDVFVDSDNEEFDYPDSEQNVYTQYTGTGGVAVGGVLWRTLWSVRMNNSKVLLTSDIRPDTRVMLYREVRERVARIAPFLMLDQDPYLVIADGRLVWIIDAYTASDRFPYSQRVSGINYMRNAVKVTVDAFDGTVTFYEMDPADPIIGAWASAFPELLTPASEMPDAIREHIRSPLDYFSVQAHLFGTYHMTDPQMFYNREDEWEVPVVTGSQMSPYYIIMKIPGEEREEFILMQPFVPRNKPNLAAWIVARSDGENYGEMLAYRFPKDKMVYGPTMIVARFNQDDEISEKVSLWNQQGSQVQFGTLLVIPIVPVHDDGEEAEESSLIYVQPLYLRADSGSIPELKRVLVGYENRIAMEPTLEGALRKLFTEDGTVAASTMTPAPSPDEPGAAEPEPADISSLPAVQRAQSHYLRMTQAAARSDWEAFGRELDGLGAALEEVAAQQEAPPPVEPPGEGTGMAPDTGAVTP